MSSKVYFLTPERWREVPDAMKACGVTGIIKKDDFVAVKLHLGEKGNKGYVKAEQAKPVVTALKDLKANVFVTDANTIYRGERTDAVHHLMVASEHNYHPKYLGAPVVIADGLRGNNFIEVDVGLKHFKKVKIAEAIYNADAIVAISHFKGHELCGMGGAIKNLGMGCASRQGKYEQHNSVVPSVKKANCTACGACVKWCSAGALKLTAQLPPLEKGGRGGFIQLDPKKCVGCGQCILACNFKVFDIPWNENAGIVQEKIAEYACGVLKNKRAMYINYLTFITDRCDCFKTTTKPIMPDIGILISTDPVAIDQACMDLIDKHAGRDILKEFTGMDGHIQIAYAEKLGLGSRKYELINNQ